MTETLVDLQLSVEQLVLDSDVEQSNQSGLLALVRQRMRADLKADSRYAELVQKICMSGHMVGKGWIQEPSTLVPGTRLMLTVYDAGALPELPHGEKVIGLLTEIQLPMMNGDVDRRERLIRFG